MSYIIIQTGSGKTYCMTGTEEERGVIPMVTV